MPIRIRFLLIISCSFLGLIFVQKYFVIPQMKAGFFEVEISHAQSAHKRLAQLFQSKMEYFESKIYDWAVWDETFNFIQGKNPNFLQSHIPDPSVFFEALKVDYAIIFDLSGQSKLVLSNDHPGRKYPHQLPADLIGAVWKSIDGQAEQVQSGVMNLNGSPLAFASSKIRKGDGSGIHPGYFVVIEKLDSEFEKELSISAASSVQVTSLIGQSKYPDPYEFQDLNTLKISVVLKAAEGQPIALLSQKLSREIHQTAIQTARNLEFFMMGVLGLTFLGMLMLMRNQVIGPILDFSNWLRTVAQRGDWKTNRFNKRFGGINLGDSKIRHEVDELVESSNVLLDKISDSNDVIHKQTMLLVNSEKIRSLGEMSGGVAHEINNPLMIIMTQIELLKRELQRDGIDSKKLQIIAEKMESTALRIKKIVTGLLKFSRDGERDPLVLGSVAQAVSDAADLFGEKLKNNHVDLIQELDPNVMAKIRSTQISQVVMNLIGNSIDAIQKLDRKWIKIRVFAEAEKAYIQVIDSGTGIPKEYRDKVLQPFFTTKEIGKGTGLGLSISLGLVEEHNGKLCIDHNAPHTTFVIELPLAQSDSASKAMKRVS